MEFQEVIYSREDDVATMALNRPEALNALTPRMVDELVTAIEEAKQDNEVKVVVLTGAGRGFCSGMDVRAVAARGPQASLVERRNEMRESIHRVPRALAGLDKPLIGSINGAAAGAGMDMASMCDLRIASNKAKFAMSYVRMGLIPGDGGCYFLPRIIGMARALELIWTGRMIDAEEALRIGYVNKVVPHQELAAATRELATQLARGPAIAIQLAKRLAYRGLYMDLNTALEAAETAQLIARSTEDAIEGPRAWVEKREPRFKGK